MSRDNKTTRLSVLGTTGLNEYGGVINEEFLTNLRGINGQKIYREMADNAAIVGAILFNIDMLIRQVDWHVSTPKGLEEDPTAIKEKEFIESCLDDMSHTWEDFISEILTMLWAGWSYFEIVYKLRKGHTNNPQTNSEHDDGRFGWRKFEARGQDTLWHWLFDEEGGLEGMTQIDAYRGMGPVDIPIEKSLLFRTRAIKGNPEGRSLLRPGVRSWYFMKRLQEIEAIGADRDLTGMPIMEVPQQLMAVDADPLDQALRRELETMIQQVKINSRWGGVVPAEVDRDGVTGFKFKLMSSGGSRMIDLSKPIVRYESRLAMLFSMEFLMLGQDGVGAKSADLSKKDFFKLAMNTILSDMIAAPFNRFAVGRLMRLNNVPKKYWPTLKHANLDSPDLQKMGAFIQSLATSGVLSPNRGLEDKLLTDAGLPTPPEEDLELFSDPTRPTPRESADQSTGVISDSQIKAVMDINRAIKEHKISFEVAKELAAAALGMDIASVSRFLIPEPEVKPQPTSLQPSQESEDVDPSPLGDEEESDDADR